MSALQERLDAATERLGRAPEHSREWFAAAAEIEDAIYEQLGALSYRTFALRGDVAELEGWASLLRIIRDARAQHAAKLAERLAAPPPPPTPPGGMAA